MSASTASHQRSTTGSHMRLTRRGRVMVLAILVAVLFATFSLGRSASQAAPPTPTPTPEPATTAVTVQQGESLWSLARRVSPEKDPREVVARIRGLNDLTSAHVTPGQQLLLPAAAA